MRRLRRLRLKKEMRDMVREVSLELSDLIYPLFVVEGSGIKKEVASMPGVYQQSVDNILKECEELSKLGIHHIILFGVPKHKDEVGSEALNDNNIVCQAIRAIKEKYNDMLISADLCFCEYTSHGHCGILDPKTQSVDNDKTLKISGEQAIVLARAGADIIAPSGMMDGIVLTLREYLDRADFSHIPIMSYSTKFASAFYGPFRDVADSAPSQGDRKSYQMDPANRREAILESLEDDAQGADILMIKPALAYMDIIREVRDRTLLPLCVYNVSGEYSMFKLAQSAGVVDYPKMLMETMLGFKRAGADIIITYHAKEIAWMLKNI